VLSGAQSYSFYDYSFNRTLVSHVNQDVEKVKSAHISSRTVEIKEYRNNGTLNNSRVFSRHNYNEAGQIRREEFYTESGNLRTARNFSFNAAGQIIKKEVFKRKKTEPYKTWELAYHNDSLLSELHAFDDKGKPTWSYRYFDNSDNQFTEQRAYRKGKLDSRFEYEYYGDKSKKEVRYYKDSLKLERTFRYDCGIGNSLLSQKQKDTVTQCSHKEELADGTVRTIYETRDEKGRIIRTVYDYNEEQKWSLTKRHDAKNRLVAMYRSDVIAEGKHKVTIERFRRGKLKYSSTSLQTKDNFGFYCYTQLENDRIEEEFYSSYTFFSEKTHSNSNHSLFFHVVDNETRPKSVRYI